MGVTSDSKVSPLTNRVWERPHSVVVSPYLAGLDLGCRHRSISGKEWGGWAWSRVWSERCSLDWATPVVVGLPVL